MSHHGQQHAYKRKKTNSDNFKILDKVCTIFSVLMPMTAIPQIYKLYYFQDASGLSIWMWILYCIGVIPFLLYGMANRVKHLIILNILWMIVQITMIIGIILYG